MSISKKLTTISIIAVLAVMCLMVTMPLQQEEAHAKVASSVVKKAKTYKKSANKLFKIGKAWYCFSKKKVRTGIQKVGKEYYFFNTSTGKMLVKTGLKKVGKAYYYFSKKSGKAPALRTSVITEKDGKVWFFKSNGQRYEYSYFTTDSKAGNIAAGVIISSAGIKNDGSSLEENLLKVYQKIVKNYGYSFLTPKEPVTVEDLGDVAKSMTDTKEGKCYNYAALTYVTFRALGASPVYYNGHFQSEDRVHAWVVMSGEDGNLYMYDSNQDNVNGKGTDFFGKLINQHDGLYSLTIGENEYTYYPGASIH